MLRAILFLIPLHSILAQADAWSGNGEYRLAIYCLAGTAVNFLILLKWADGIHYDDFNTPANVVWNFLSLLGFYIIASSHPYFYYPAGQFFSGAPTMEFSHISIFWITQFHQNFDQFAQTVYAVSLFGILLAAVLVLGRGTYLFLIYRLPAQTAKMEGIEAELQTVRSQFASETQAITSRITEVEEAQYKILIRNPSDKTPPEPASKFADDNPLAAFKGL